VQTVISSRWVTHIMDAASTKIRRYASSANVFWICQTDLNKVVHGTLGYLPCKWVETAMVLTICESLHKVVTGLKAGVYLSEEIENRLKNRDETVVCGDKKLRDFMTLRSFTTDDK
jgi:hypothetical protein